MKFRNWPLLALIAVFITPFIAAMLILGAFDQQFKTNQHGNFVAIPTQVTLSSLTDLNGVPIPTTSAANKWRVIYEPPNPCTAECIAAKNLLNNVHKALGKERSRVVFAVGKVGQIDLESAANLFIIDPEDRCIMYYTADHEPQGLLKDLKKLLKYSHAH